MIHFPSEIETYIKAEQERIWIEQSHEDGSTSIIELTISQFTRIVQREKDIIRSAMGSEDVL